MFEDYPVEYFWGLITLAKVLKIETGQPGDFDKPRTREEALDRLERTAGPKAQDVGEVPGQDRRGRAAISGRERLRLGSASSWRMPWASWEEALGSPFGVIKCQRLLHISLWQAKLTGNSRRRDACFECGKHSISLTTGQRGRWWLVVSCSFIEVRKSFATPLLLGKHCREQSVTIPDLLAGELLSLSALKSVATVKGLRWPQVLRNNVPCAN
jgi:hypothetical protein